MSWHPGPMCPGAIRGVHVWRIALDEAIDGTGAQGDLTLPAEERSAAGRLVDPNAQRRLTVSRIARRDILGRYLQQPPADLTFVDSAHGKPQLGGAATGRLHFNTSRSGSVGLLAVHSSRDIGVDIEMIRPVRDVDEIVARYFAPAEVQQFMRVPQQVRGRAFICAWARKEAFVKALGIGLSMELSRCAVDMTNELTTCGLLAIDGDEEAATAWTVCDVEVASHFAAAVAVKERAVEVEYFDWRPRRGELV